MFTVLKVVKPINQRKSHIFKRTFLIMGYDTYKCAGKNKFSSKLISKRVLVGIKFPQFKN